MKKITLLTVLIVFINNSESSPYLENIFTNNFDEIVCEASDECFYVSVNGTSSNCSIQSPCNLQTAKSKLSGGDYLYFLQGRYSDSYLFTEGAYGDYQMILAFGRSHTFQDPAPSTNNRITIKAYPGHNVIIDGQYNIDMDSGAQCFYSDQSFITFTGFTFKDCKIGINIGQNRITDDVIGTIVEKNAFIGNHFVNDNGGNISIYGFSLNAIVRNNLIIGPGRDIGSMNSAGIYFTHDRGIQLLNNEISRHRTGIHYKHDHNPSIGNTGSILAYNYIHDVSISARLNNRYLNIHNNISASTAGSFSINHCSGVTGEGGDYNSLTNNYFHALNLNGCSDGVIDQGAYQNTIKNNIIASRFYIHPWQSTPHESILDFNIYVDDLFENNISYSLTAWQNYFGQDNNSLTGLPLFTNSKLHNILDYKLLPSSIGFQTDEFGNDIGPNIDGVGIQYD